MKISVLGYDWNILVLPKKDFKRRFGKITAITLLDTNEVYFRSDRLNLLNVRHEITHAFLKYTCIDELNLSQQQFEEFMCDFTGVHAETVLRLSDQILKELK